MQSLKQDNKKRILNRRSKQEIESLIEAWKKSGVSIKEFCREHNIAHSTFTTWLIKQRQEKNPKQKNIPKKAFIPIKVESSIDAFSSDHYPHVEVVLSSGAKVTFYKEVEVSFLRALIS